MKKKKRMNKKFSLSSQYKLVWKYMKESRYFIFFAILIFFAFAFLGFFMNVPENISNIILDFLKEILKETEGLTSFGLIRFIFLNNLKSSIIGFFFGFVVGIVPLIFLVFNGFVLGFVSAMAVESGGFGTLLYLLPHGIFELPAIFISLGLGIKLGSFIFQKDIKNSFKKYLLEGLRVFVFVILPLLIIAAIIEGLLI